MGFCYKRCTLQLDTFLVHLRVPRVLMLTGHVNIGRISLSHWKFRLVLICYTQSNSDWLIITQSIVLPADWLILENQEKLYT